MGLIEKFKNWFKRKSRPEETPLISVVLLLRRPSALTQDMLHDAAVRAWGRNLRAEENEFVLMQGPIGFVNFEGRVFHAINMAKPYLDDREAAVRGAKELRQKEVLQQQQAWMSIDLMVPAAPEGGEKAQCYRRMCSLAAQFADSVCLGVYLPEEGVLRPNDGTLRDALIGDDPRASLAQFEHVPVIGIEETNPELKHAVSEARRRWPEFVEAFRARTAEEAFSAKAPFTDGQHTEWMWVRVDEIEGEFVSGELGNEPVNVRGFHEGDRVRARAREIGDWIYGGKGKAVGGFSVKVLANAARKK